MLGGYLLQGALTQRFHFPGERIILSKLRFRLIGIGQHRFGPTIVEQHLRDRHISHTGGQGMG